MRLFDLRQMDENSLIETDLCVVGSGPAGLTIAREFAGTDIEVLVLEGGGVEKEPATQSLYDVENAGPCRRPDEEKRRVRILGGTSRVWTGRCAPFDPMDFEERSWVAYSGWPFTRADMDPYLERAGAYLGLGPHCYDETLWRLFRVPPPSPSLDERFLQPTFWQFSRSPNVPGSSVDFGRDLLIHRDININILVHSNITHITTTQDGSRVESVEVSTLENRRSRVRARAVVLACGGIENARLLLASNRIMPRGVGNEHDVVGRFLMDHPLCILGHFDPKEAAPVRARFGHYWLDDQHGRHVYLHGVSLSAEIRRREHLLGCDAFIEEYDVARDDPWQTMRRFASDLKSRRLSRTTVQDGLSLLSHPGEIGHGLYRRLGRHRPPFAKANRIELHCMLEQMPDPESRITLSPERRDALGMPISRINWKIGEAERLSARRMIQLVCQEFSRLTLPIPHPSPWLTDGDRDYRFEDKAHPTGTTRLSLNPREGVVDTNLQVHNVQGLFIAGSSVFPTSGTANPTLMIVALSLRLADWLKSVHFKPHVPAQIKLSSVLEDCYVDAGPKDSRATVKVGLIGTGQRISEIYLPILKRLSDRYEIVGFTTRSTDSARKFESRTGISAFASASELVERQRPSFLIAAVASPFNDVTLMNLIDLRIPILAETPLAWSVSSGSAIVRKAADNKVLVAVAEQFPYRPIEQFRRQLIDLGVFGDIYVAYNDFCSYDYHGIAQLRRYLKGKPTQARCMEYNFGTDPAPGPRDRGSSIRWRVGSVAFDDGAMLFHQYSGHYVDSDLGFPQATRIYGKMATMVDDEIRVVNGETGHVETAVATHEQNDINTLELIAVTLPKLGVVTWRNPYAGHPFTDDQIAVATLLDGMSQAVQTGCPPLYTAEDFLTNVAIMQAFRYSGYRGGARIPLPFNEIVHKARVAMDLGHLRSKARGILSRRGS